MRKILLIPILCFFSMLEVWSVPAYNRIVTLANGVKVFLRGDENCKWGITEDGYTILPTESGWVYAQQVSGKTVASSYRLVSEEEKTEEVKAFLLKQPKGLAICQGDDEEPNAGANYNSSTPLQSTPVVGERRALVIMMEFQDCGFMKSREDFDNLFNQVDYREDGAIGSVKDFFLWSSYGKLNFTCDVIGPFTAAHNMSYYGGNAGPNNNDKNPYALFEEAIQKATQTVNLSEYDSDGDGFVDNIHIIFAGYGEEAGASSSAIWSHEMTFVPINVQGMYINKYSCAPELRGNRGNGISRIGPHCHEMGHALGAMDYYDVDYETNGDFDGTGNWDVMAHGSWNNDGICPPDFNPYVKIYNFGWAVEQNLPASQETEILPSFENDSQIYRLDTPVAKEFFLLENRQQFGFDAALPGSGLVVFHIGPKIEEFAKTNKINAKHPQQCYVVCASSNNSCPNSTPSSYGKINSAGAPFPGTSNKDSFSDSTIPSANCLNGTESGILLSKIYENSDGVVSVFNGTPEPDDVFWKETFEDDECIDDWAQDAKGWKVYTVLPPSIKNPNGDMPSSVQGSKYLYSKLGGMSFSGSTLRAIEIVSSDITIDKAKYLNLDLQYFNKPKVSSSSETNKLTVHVEFDGERHLLGTLGVTGSDWKQASFDLSICNSKSFKLVFVSEGPDVGYICIDDIQITGKADVTPVPSVQFAHDATYSVYSINGTSVGHTNNPLPRGIYIISNSRSERKKIYVK